jgi:hypothetical protein
VVEGASHKRSASVAVETPRLPLAPSTTRSSARYAGVGPWYPSRRFAGEVGAWDQPIRSTGLTALPASESCIASATASNG